MLNFRESDKIKLSWKVDKSNNYNGFSGNISFITRRRTSSDKTYFEFFHILAIEKEDNIMENVKKYKRREMVKKQETDKRKWEGK